ncbi:MAG: alcohol dehydrogenase catalytic domain-containing protein [Candidatus Electrothrix aestuarii]|uniref:Alcohol dehydrogenase catalytic domain-containing protein n=1 Tax=Candidatus Electrothrix aestuarii TaxID=3062594 RepID=A0AAU8LVK3_9BACT|nr:alcohol dehydrogenase catalytic domain-containing protein [Candidatus Electrothrix aestuarii]
MKAAVVYGADDIRIEDYADPVAGPGEVVVATKVAGICGKDVKTMLGEGLTEKLPAILGQDISGEISSIGEGVVGFSVGEPVAVYPMAVCGQCYYCRQKRYNLCEKSLGIGHGLDGAFAEYVRVPKEILNVGGLIKLDDEISFEDAVMAEPLSCTFAAARANRMKEGQTVLVIGGGSMGLMHLKTAKWSGCEVIVADIVDTRLAMAGQMGADHLINSETGNLHDEVMRITEGRGADVVIISIGIPDVIEDCLKLVARGGVCNIFGAAPDTEVKIDPRWLHHQEITLTGTYASTPADFKKCLQLIKEEAIIVSDLVSHRFTLDTFDEAVESAKSLEMVRGIITFGEMVSLSF